MAAALATFRTDGAPGWAYTQKSEGEGHSRLEDFDPLKAEGLRWTLVNSDGHAPSEDELREYRLSKLQRSSPVNAPRLEKLIDLGSCQVLQDTPALLLCDFRLLPGPEDDGTTRALAVKCTLDRGSQCITRIEIYNTAPLSPSFVIRIDSMSTLIEYIPAPGGAGEGLLSRAELRINGHAFWLKSLSQRMLITWSGHRKAGPTPKP